MHGEISSKQATPAQERDVRLGCFIKPWTWYSSVFIKQTLSRIIWKELSEKTLNWLDLWCAHISDTAYCSGQNIIESYSRTGKKSTK